MKFTIASINIWDLPVSLPGSAGRLRRARLLDALPRLGADVITIQEAFRPHFKREITRALPTFSADAYVSAARGQWPFTMDGSGGLLTLSRWPILESRFAPSPDLPGLRLDERIGAKGVLWTLVDTPGGPIHFGNVHLNAGGRVLDARIRSVQVRALLASAPRAQTIVVAGDFNMAVESEQVPKSPTGFEQMFGEGFEEIAEGRSAGLETKDPQRNKWARYFPLARVALRLTHVFHRGPGLAPDGEPALCFHEQPVSDHFGLRAGFTVQPD